MFSSAFTQLGSALKINTAMIDKVFKLTLLHNKKESAHLLPFRKIFNPMKMSALNAGFAGLGCPCSVSV
jgi:hypothetical protein